MKKFLVGLVMMFVFAVGLPLAVEAHNGCPRHRSVRRTSYNRNYARTNRNYRANRNYRTNRYYRNGSADQYYETRGYSTYRRPSFYRRHRNVINVGIATGAGALIGGIARGRRGAGIGALIGAGSGALYTYGINKKKRRY
ncbi:MAG: hypothetical protein H0U50_12425 [Pyrinomonadaceae bacterium]|nr:hypothetical protein [Pyrinomonadaceae bacterium]